MFRLGFSMLGSFVRAAHSVEPGQREPGLPDNAQPAKHEVDIGALEWDLELSIGVHRRFAFEATLPVRATIIDATFTDAAGDELVGLQSIHHRDETIAGVGDLLLGGRVALVLPDDVPRWTLMAGGALSIPTGQIEADPFVLGGLGRAHQHMFFGSGTFDPVAGLDTQVAFDAWSLVAWASTRARLRTNRFGYRGSTVVGGGIGAQSDFGLRRWVFIGQPEVYFETSARWANAAARNSGRTSLLASLGAFFSPTPAWQVHALAKVPIFTRSQGGQVRWPVVGIIGFSYSFDIDGDEA